VELLEHERFAAGLAAIEQLLCDLPGDPELLLFRAALLLHAGHLELAEMACGELLAREASAAAHYLLALCHERAGKLSVAREHHRVAAHLDATLAMPRLHLGLMARRSGEGASARRELGQALLLLEREPRQRLTLFAGGFGREALIALCRAELTAAGGNT
jgi:chemotaxis protein methyltransferase CheR